jgi:hypothetical protein
MARLTAFILSLALVGHTLAAEQKFDPKVRAKVIAPYLDEEAIAVFHVDVTRLNPEGIFTRLADLGIATAKETAESRKAMEQAIKQFTKAGGKDFYLVASLADVNGGRGPGRFVIIPLAEGADEEALLKLAGPPFETSSKLAGGKAIFGGSKAELKRLQSLQAPKRPELLKAFAAAGDTAAQFLVLPTFDNRRVLEEVMPMLPRQIGGGSSQIITEGLRWAALGIDLPPKAALRLVIQSKDADSAEALHKLIERGVRVAGRQEFLHKLLPNFATFTKRLIPEVEEDRLVLNLGDKELGSLVKQLRPLVVRARGEAQRQISMNNLRQIGIAMHNYLDTYKTFPTAASYSKQGKPLLSWRVHILPFIEQDRLYKQFHLDEPWDSPHNKKLIPLIPKTYQSGNAKLARAGKTRYLAPLGKATMFPGRKGLKIADVPDGTSNTIFIVEATEEKAVVWTSPEDLQYDPEKPFAGLVGKNKTGFLAVFVDGSARVLPAKIDPKTLRALFTRNGGEPIPEIP